jgi:hypothetical protein
MNPPCSKTHSKGEHNSPTPVSTQISNHTTPIELCIHEI